jgi:hypothetical protein
LGKLYQDTKGAERDEQSEAAGERPPGGEEDVRIGIELGGINMRVQRVQNRNGMFQGSNIKRRIILRRDIEKKRYGRVRPAVVIFFVNLVDCFHHGGWQLVLISCYLN